VAPTSDVVVIGGGIIGLAVAYHLRRALLGVTLVERDVVGTEASWAAVGYVSFQGESTPARPTPGTHEEKAGDRQRRIAWHTQQFLSGCCSQHAR
jgi:glycine/D-amino acid oxidase-like deaminating enzyme